MRQAPPRWPAKPRLRRHPPLRFGWLLLAPLDNASGAAAVCRPSRIFVAILRCASAGSYSLRSTMRQAPPRVAGEAASSSPAVLRCASAGSYSLRSTMGRVGAAAAGPAARLRRHPPLRFGWLLLAPLDNASGAAAVGRPKPRLRRHPPLRFGGLLLAPLDNASGAAAVAGRPSRVFVAILRCASAGSYSLRSTMRQAPPRVCRPSRVFVAIFRCASAGSYSLRSTMRQAPPRCAGEAASSSPSSAALRLAPTRSARQCVRRRRGVAKPTTSSSPSSAALRLAPTRSARQCVRRRRGVPAKPRLRRHPPLRFGWLLLAPLDNASGAAAVCRPSRVFVAILRCASAGSYSLRSTMRQAPPRCARQCTGRTHLFGAPLSLRTS